MTFPNSPLPHVGSALGIEIEKLAVQIHQRSLSEVRSERRSEI